MITTNIMQTIINTYDSIIFSEYINKTNKIVFDHAIIKLTKSERITFSDVLEIISKVQILSLDKRILLKTNRMKFLTMLQKYNQNYDLDIKLVDTSPKLIYKTNVGAINNILKLSSGLPEFETLSTYLYAYYVEPINDHRDYCLIKFGFTTNSLEERAKQLEKEYNASFRLIWAAKITSSKLEKNFHIILKNNYPELVEPYEHNGKQKTELYKLSLCLLDKYFDYCTIDKKFIIDSDMVSGISKKKKTGFFSFLLG